MKWIILGWFIAGAIVIVGWLWIKVHYDKYPRFYDRYTEKSVTKINNDD